MAKAIVVKILGDAKDAINAFAQTEDRAAQFAKVGAVAVAAVGTAAVGAGAALFKIGSDFDDMKDTIVLGTGASGEALDGLFQSAKNVMSTVPDSGALVSTVIADVNTFFGATGTELETLSEGFLDFARLTGMETSDAIDRLDGVMTTFNLTTGEADELMGDLVRISQATGISMDDLTTQVDKWGPSFAEAGLSAEEAAAMLGKFNQAGLDVESAGKSFNKFLLDAAENGLNADQAMAQLDKQMATLSGPERLAAMEDIFGAKNAQAALQAYESGALALDDFNGLLGEGAGVVAEQTEATADFAETWGEFKNKVLVQLEPLATEVFNAVGNAMERIGPVLTEVVGGVVAFVAAFRDGGDDITSSGFAGAMERIGITLRNIVDWIRANKDYVVAGLTGFGIAVATVVIPAFVTWAVAAGAAALATIAAAAPVIALGVALAALAVGIVWLWKNWDEVWAKIKQVTAAAAGWVVAKFVELKDGAAATVSGLVDAVVGFITSMPGRISAAASGMFDGIKDAFRSAVNWIIDKWNGLEFTIGGGSFLGQDIPSLTLGTPNIPRFHDGGVVPGRYGQEVFAILQAGETVRTRDQEAALGGGIRIENLYVTERPMLEEFIELEARYGVLV